MQPMDKVQKPIDSEFLITWAAATCLGKALHGVNNEMRVAVFTVTQHHQPRDLWAFLRGIYWFLCPLPCTASPRINPGNRPVSRLTPLPTTSLSNVKGKVTLLCIPGTTSNQPVLTSGGRSTNLARFKAVLPDHQSNVQLSDDCDQFFLKLCSALCKMLIIAHLVKNSLPLIVLFAWNGQRKPR
jgi:hypothetical protein